MEYVHCPLCEADNSSLIFKRKDLRYHVSEDEFSVVRCQKCSMVYVNPRPTEAEIHAYYTIEFYEVNINAEQLLRENERSLSLKYQYIKDISPGKLLDIGCLKGEFMFFMQQKGWEVYGTDFSTRAPNVFELDIFYGDLDAAEYKPASFDLITLWAVLEHVYNPKKMLLKINELLKPDGKVVLAVTNFNSVPAYLMRHDDIPRHTTLFTKHTMQEMLRCANFKASKFYFNCELYGGSNRGILNFLFKLAMGEKIEDIVTYNRSIEYWHKFSSQIRGKDSAVMLKIDSIDIALAPYLDRLLDILHFGFIMIARGTK